MVPLCHQRISVLRRCGVTNIATAGSDHGYPWRKADSRHVTSGNDTGIPVKADNDRTLALVHLKFSPVRLLRRGQHIACRETDSHVVSKDPRPHDGNSRDGE